MSEHDEQAAFFSALQYWDGKYPELKFIFAVPNGGQRNKIVAAKLKAEGVRRGVPDIIVPIARYGISGLAIEMKFGRNQQTPEQVEYQEFLEKNLWSYVICYRAMDALQAVFEYLGIEDAV